MEIVIGIVALGFLIASLIVWAVSRDWDLPSSGSADSSEAPGVAAEEASRESGEAEKAEEKAEEEEEIEEENEGKNTQDHAAQGEVDEEDAEIVLFAPDSELPHLTILEARIKAEAEGSRNSSEESAQGEAETDENVLTGKAKRDEKLGVLYIIEPDDADDLTGIKGVGAVISGKLNACGIYKFKQIGQWTPEMAAEFGKKLSFKDRIGREDWIGQCRELHREKYGEDA